MSEVAAVTARLRNSFIAALAVLVSSQALAQSAAPAAPPSDVPPARSQAAPTPQPQASRGTRRQTQYIDASTLNLVRLLPPPPANDSAETRAELKHMMSLQKTRTKAQVVRARADADVNLSRFADALGDPPGFQIQNLPLLVQLFRKITTDEFVVVGTGKDAFARPRPWVLEPRLKPIVGKPPNGAYPSGHTVWGHTVGLVLADMIPERRAQIMARAAEYSNNRVIAGVHYPSDIESGRMAATAFAAALFASPVFQSDFAAARAELRQALNLATLH